MVNLMMVETNRVILYPANQEEMEAYIATETCSELRAAYSEMLEGCLQHPDEWEWYAIKKYNPESIGYAWDDNNPRIQLEPIGTRGYIELHPVKSI